MLSSDHQADMAYGEFHRLGLSGAFAQHQLRGQNKYLSTPPLDQQQQQQQQQHQQQHQQQTLVTPSYSLVEDDPVFWINNYSNAVATPEPSDQVHGGLYCDWP
jgi:hypothetical protein